MIKRRGKSQIGNLIPDHKPFESRVQMNSDWGMLCTFGKDLFDGYKILPSYSQN
jgi:hypothetical protein